MRESESPESLPSCVGYFEAPLPPNDCETCKIADLCKKLTLAKQTLQTVLVKLEELKVTLKGETPA